MTNPLTLQGLKVANLILKPFDKNNSKLFNELLSQVPSKREKNFLCLLFVILGVPNYLNQAMASFCQFLDFDDNYNQLDKNQKQKDNSNSIKPSQLNQKKVLEKDFAIQSIGFPYNLDDNILFNFWDFLPSFSSQHANFFQTKISLFLDFIPTSFNRRFLQSLFSMKNSSILVVTYIRKIPIDKLNELIDFLLKKGNVEQITLYAPYIITLNKNLLNNWLDDYIADSKNPQYELLVSSAFGSFLCPQISQENLNKIIINFLNGTFSINSHFFESFLFYVQQHDQIYDRSNYATNEDFIISFFYSLISNQTSLLDETTICPDLFTQMITKKIAIPPYSISIFFSKLNRRLLIYSALQFISNKSYLAYLDKCYQRSIQVRQNSFSRKLLDYSIMALFIKTVPSDSIRYSTIINLMSLIKITNDEFSHFIYIHIARMFVFSPMQRKYATRIIQNWKTDSTTLVLLLILRVFQTKNLETLQVSHDVICKRGGHALTVLYDLSSAVEFFTEKGRKPIFTRIIKSIVPDIKLNRVKISEYMPVNLRNFLSGGIQKVLPKPMNAKGSNTATTQKKPVVKSTNPTDGSSNSTDVIVTNQQVENFFLSRIARQSVDKKELPNVDTIVANILYRIETMNVKQIEQTNQQLKTRPVPPKPAPFQQNSSKPIANKTNQNNLARNATKNLPNQNNSAKTANKNMVSKSNPNQNNLAKTTDKNLVAKSNPNQTNSSKTSTINNTQANVKFPLNQNNVNRNQNKNISNGNTVNRNKLNQTTTKPKPIKSSDSNSKSEHQVKQAEVNEIDLNNQNKIESNESLPSTKESETHPNDELHLNQTIEIPPTNANENTQPIINQQKDDNNKEIENTQIEHNEQDTKKDQNQIESHPNEVEVEKAEVEIEKTEVEAEVNQNNDGVVYGMMKRLFGFGSSLLSRSTPVKPTGDSHHSVPPSPIITTTEAISEQSNQISSKNEEPAPSKIDDGDSHQSELPKAQKDSNLHHSRSSVVRSPSNIKEPIVKAQSDPFIDDIELSDQDIAIPDESYSSTVSEDNYSVVSDIDFDLSDEEIPFYDE